MILDLTSQKLTSQIAIPCGSYVFFGKSMLQVPDTDTRVLANTRPFLRSSIVSFWITAARSKECKYHVFRQYWYAKNVPVFTNTGTFQYLGPEVYFFLFFKVHHIVIMLLEVEIEVDFPFPESTVFMNTKLCVHRSFTEPEVFECTTNTMVWVYNFVLAYPDDTAYTL